MSTTTTVTATGEPLWFFVNRARILVGPERAAARRQSST
jgi:hypothetical protein